MVRIMMAVIILVGLSLTACWEDNCQRHAKAVDNGELEESVKLLKTCNDLIDTETKGMNELEKSNYICNRPYLNKGLLSIRYDEACDKIKSHNFDHSNQKYEIQCINDNGISVNNAPLGKKIYNLWQISAKSAYIKGPKTLIAFVFHYYGVEPDFVNPSLIYKGAVPRNYGYSLLINQEVVAPITQVYNKDTLVVGFIIDYQPSTINPLDYSIKFLFTDPIPIKGFTCKFVEPNI